MKNQAIELNQGQLTLFSRGEAVEDLLYEFLKDRGPLTEKAYQRDLKEFFGFTTEQFGLPRLLQDKLLFEEIRRVFAELMTTVLQNGYFFRQNNYKKRIPMLASDLPIESVREDIFLFDPGKRLQV